MAGIFCNISVLHLFHLKGPSKYLVPIKTNGDRIVAKVGSEIAAKVYPKKAFIEILLINLRSLEPLNVP